MMKLKDILLILLLLTISSPASANYTDHRNRKIDSLENLLSKHLIKDKKELVWAYNSLAWGYLEMNEEKSTHYAKLGIKAAEEMKGYKMLVDFYRILGMHHWGHGRYKQSEQCYLQALQMVEKMRESKKYSELDLDDNTSSLYGSMGNLYNSWGQGTKAIEYYVKALKLFQKHGWKESQSIAYGCIAELYYGIGNLERAETYQKKGLKLAQETGDTLMYTYNVQGLAKVHMQRKEWKKAEEEMQFVYDYLFSHPDQEGSSRATCLLIMADICLYKGDIQKAEQYIRQHEEMDLGPEAAFDCQKALLASLKGDWQQTRQLAEQALKTDQENTPEIQIEGAWLLAKAYAHLGQADRAVAMMSHADSLRTLQSNYAYQNSLTEQEARFESEIKDMTIEGLHKSRTTYIILLVVALLLIAALIVLFIIRRRANERQKKLLTAQVTMETEVKERQMLAKDLHDGLGSTLSLLKLKIREHVSGEALQILDKSIGDLRRISHHIMPEELVTHGLEVSLRDFAASIPEAQFQCFGERQTLQQDVELVLYRCAYELVNNIIKHAEASHIDIQLMYEPGNVVLTVSDNGKGFDPTQETKGMGLLNIRSRIERYKGTLNIITQPGNGTEINVNIPI